jgi:hypothetical protein
VVSGFRGHINFSKPTCNCSPWLRKKMQFAVLPLLLMKLLRVEYIREKKGREWSVGEEEGSIAEERRAGSECCERSKSKE